MSKEPAAHNHFGHLTEEVTALMRDVKTLDEELTLLLEAREAFTEHNYEAKRTMYEARACVEVAIHWVSKTRLAIATGKPRGEI